MEVSNYDVAAAAADITAGGFPGTQIDVLNLSYGVYLGGHRKVFKKILNEVSFKLKPGSLCALMGPSGSGKSTLLDLLADRTLVGEWSGSILFDNGPRSRWFSRDSAYILQDDLHIPTLTVRETIYFSACCKLPEGAPRQFIDRRVNELLEITGLDGVQDSFVGDASHKGISGGQLKRLSIAVEIVSMPKTIFLDEPTSGLDSSIALDVMAAIRRIADQNRTCISTIHQPSPSVYGMFDSVVLLSQGHLIYFGPAKDVVPYFTGAPLNYYHTPGQNPAEFIIEISEGIITPKNTSVAPELSQFVRIYKASSYHKPYRALLDTAVKPSSDFSTSTNSFSMPKVDMTRLHATTKLTQFRMLMWRDGISILRDTDALIAVMVKSIVVGLLIGTVFFKQGETTLPMFSPLGVPYAEVQNISALLFFGMMHSMITNVEAIPHICSKNLIFRREINAFTYSVSPYWLSACISPLPLLFLGFLIFVLITFFLCHFKQNVAYFAYYATAVFLANLCSYFLALLLGAVVKKEGTALVVFPLIFLFFSTFAGYPILIENVPPFWSWAPTINFVRWCYQGLMVNQWSSFDADADAGGSVLALYGFQHWNKVYSLLIMLFMLILTSLLAYLAMRPPKRRLVYIVLAEQMGKAYGYDDGSSPYRFSAFLERSRDNSSATSNSHSKNHKTVLQEALLPPPSSTKSHQSLNPLHAQSQRANAPGFFDNLASQEDDDIQLETKSDGGGSYRAPNPSLLSPRQSHQSHGLDAGSQSGIDEARGSRRTYDTISTLTVSMAQTQETQQINPMLERDHDEEVGLARPGHKSKSIGYCLAFRDLNYYVKVPGVSVNANPTADATKGISSSSSVVSSSSASSTTLQILRDVTGYANAGEICALMGASGAGKTTLLDILAYRKTVGEITGAVYINNHRIQTRSSVEAMKRLTAYVMQDNVLLGCLTVHENLLYAAQLRLPRQRYGIKECEQRVQELLSMLGLSHVQNSRVGTESERGISGGQKKRVSIGVEIIHFPGIIFLDEPTTGLDSAISFEVMHAVRQLANQQRTVICTIHQPSPQTYALFDKLLLLGKGGRVLYYGAANAAVDYFQQGIFRFPYLEGSNPAEFVIAVASGSLSPQNYPVVDGITSAAGENGEKVSSEALFTVFQSSALAQDLNHRVQSITDAAIQQHEVEVAHPEQISYTDPFGAGIKSDAEYNGVWRQIPVLVYRTLLVKRREFTQTVLALIKPVVISLFYGTIFYNLPGGTSPSVYLNRISILFFSLISVLMSHQADIPDILEERLLFNRERASTTITTESYWLAKLCIDVPFNLICMCIYAPIIYKLCGLRNTGANGGQDAAADHFFFFLYILSITDIIAYFAAQFVANVSPSSQVAMSIFPVLMFFVLAFEGFIIYLPQYPAWSSWATYVSYLRYSYQALILNEFQDNPDLPLSQVYIDELGFNTWSKRQCGSIIWVFVLCHAAVAFLVLKYVNYIKR